MSSVYGNAMEGIPSGWPPGFSVDLAKKKYGTTYTGDGRHKGDVFTNNDLRYMAWNDYWGGRLRDDMSKRLDDFQKQKVHEQIHKNKEKSKEKEQKKKNKDKGGKPPPQDVENDAPLDPDGDDKLFGMDSTVVLIAGCTALALTTVYLMSR